jgi:hypothetical protein
MSRYSSYSHALFALGIEKRPARFVAPGGAELPAFFGILHVPVSDYTTHMFRRGPWHEETLPHLRKPVKRILDWSAYPHPFAFWNGIVYRDVFRGTHNYLLCLERHIFRTHPLFPVVAQVDL